MDRKIILLLISMIFLTCGDQKYFILQEDLVNYCNQGNNIDSEIVVNKKVRAINNFSVSSIEKGKYFRKVNRETQRFVIHLPLLDSLFFSPRDISGIQHMDSTCFTSEIKDDLDVYYCGSLPIVKGIDSHLFLLVNDEREQNAIEMNLLKNRYLILVNMYGERVTSTVVLAHYFRDGFSEEILSSQRKGDLFILQKKEEAFDVLMQDNKRSNPMICKQVSRAEFEINAKGQIVMVKTISMGLIG